MRDFNFSRIGIFGFNRSELAEAWVPGVWEAPSVAGSAPEGGLMTPVLPGETARGSVSMTVTVGFPFVSPVAELLQVC